MRGVTEGDDVRSPAADAAAASVDVEELLAYAGALIGAPSENPGGTEDEAASVAADILTSLGATPEIIRSDDGRPSVVARFGDGSRPSLAWNGHLDTVPAGSPDRWTSPPFAGEIRDGKLIGRGACDMKGAIAAALASAAAIARVGVPLAGSLWFHLAADEELAGIHGTKVLWERGMLDQDAAIVGEPTELQLGMAQRGGAWVTATAHGRAAHGSQPHRGVNAITSIARLMLRLEEALPDLKHPLIGGPTVNAALIEGGSAPNVVPDRAQADFYIRYPDEVYLRTVREFVDNAAKAAALATGTKVKIDNYGSSRDGIGVASLSEIAFALLKTYGAGKVVDQPAKPQGFEESGSVSRDIPGIGFTAYSSDAPNHTYEMEQDNLKPVGHTGFILRALSDSRERRVETLPSHKHVPPYLLNSAVQARVPAGTRIEYQAGAGN